eukprot:365276-Chlamydomonas_euryale.AAC.2
MHAPLHVRLRNASMHKHTDSCLPAACMHVFIAHTDSLQGACTPLRGVHALSLAHAELHTTTLMPPPSACQPPPPRALWAGFAPNVSIWILNKRGLQETHRGQAPPRGWDRAFEAQRRGCAQMARLKHPSVVKVVEPLEESASQVWDVRARQRR